MQRLLSATVVLLLLATSITAHQFNHEGRDLECDVWGAPEHAVGDGHAHTHDATEAAALNLHDHDPCKQVGMAYPSFQAAGPLDEISLTSALLGGGGNGVPYLLDGEAFRLPVDGLTEQTNLVAVGDRSLAAQGFPGSGTSSDPYIIEGFLIRNVLQLKDTDACVVIRNNVIHSEALLGGVIDPDDVRLRIDDLAALQDQIDAARAEVATLLADAARLDPVLTNLSIAVTEMSGERARLQEAFEDLAEREAAYKQQQAERSDEEASLLDAIAQLERQESVWQDALDAARMESSMANANADAARLALDDLMPAMDALGLEAGELHEAFADYQESHQRDAPAAPEQGITQTLAYLQHAAQEAAESSADDWAESFAALEAQIQELRDEEAALQAALDDAVAQNGAARIVVEEATSSLAGAQEDLGQRIAQLQDHRSQDAPEDEQLRAEREALEAAWADFQERFTQLRQERDAVVAQHQDLHRGAAQGALDVQALLDAYDALAASIAALPLEYLGELYATLEDIIEAVLEALDHPEDGAGRLILDWNGQCIHAYNNIIEDLRVNRNNDRNGYATGGIIEQNRIDVVGQIRHYDGIFRHNEVGDRAHLEAMLDPEMEQPATERAVNTDGFNQGWMHDNTIYGSIDLDFHGHHHGAGFFAPSSHYHGSAYNVAYMVNGQGGCSAANVPSEYPDSVQGELEAELGLSDEHCLPHHNHHLRWTSVRFADNTIIDPLGVGLRYEDRNHRGDDEQANSENMEVLKQPHTHQAHIVLTGNAVVGTLRIDVFNADGTDLWSDDWSEVQTDGTGRILEAALHLGAEIVNSHPNRNNAWLDISDNLVLLHDAGAAIRVNDAKDMDRLAIVGNDAARLGPGFDSGMDAAGFLQWLDDADPTAPTTWGGQAGMATGILLQRIHDSRITVCSNSFHGFGTGMRADQGIRDDVNLRTCPDNEWGGADPRIRVAFTSQTPEQKEATEPLQDITDNTPTQEVARATYDVAEAEAEPATNAISTVTNALP